MYVPVALEIYLHARVIIRMNSEVFFTRTRAPSEFMLTLKVKQYAFPLLVVFSFFSLCNLFYITYTRFKKGSNHTD